MYDETGAVSIVADKMFWLICLKTPTQNMQLR